MKKEKLQLMKTKLILLALPLLMGACSYFKIKDDSFLLSVERVQSSQAWVEVMPDGNSYSYVCDVVKASDYHSYHTDRKFIEAHFDGLKENYAAIVALYDSLGVTAPSIESLLFNNGPLKDAVTGLEPGTDYLVCLYCLNSKHKPIHKLLKKAFTTPAKPHSDIEFSLAVVPTNDTLIIIPTNNDPYFWEVALRSSALKSLDVDSVDANDAEDILGSALLGHLWFANVLTTYYSWGFSVQDMTTQGESLLSLYDTTVSLKEGDAVYVGCVGYDNEPTTENVVYRLVYHVNKPVEIERLEDPFADLIDPDSTTDTQDNKKATLRRALQKRATLVPRKKAVDSAIGAGQSLIRTRQFPR